MTIAEYHSRPISVAGAVKNPITFQAVGPVTLLDALTRAGGLSPEAGREILVSRTQPAEDGAPTTLVQRIPVKALIDAADPEMNLRLAGGEEIRVPEVGKIYVVGTVRKPGRLPRAKRLGDHRASDAGPGRGTGALRLQARLHLPPGEPAGAKREIPIELSRILQRKAPDVPLEANDILYIPDNSRTPDHDERAWNESPASGPPRPPASWSGGVSRKGSLLMAERSWSAIFPPWWSSIPSRLPTRSPRFWRPSRRRRPSPSRTTYGF